MKLDIKNQLVELIRFVKDTPFHCTFCKEGLWAKGILLIFEKNIAKRNWNWAGEIKEVICQRCYDYDANYTKSKEEKSITVIEWLRWLETGDIRDEQTIKKDKEQQELKKMIISVNPTKEYYDYWVGKNILGRINTETEITETEITEENWPFYFQYSDNTWKLKKEIEVYITLKKHNITTEEINEILRKTRHIN